jgi:Protein of unknown function (DUF805).
MNDILRFRSLAWPLRLLVALVGGVLATRVSTGWFGGFPEALGTMFGWQPVSIEMFVYHHLLLLVSATAGSFVTAAIFGRFELAVAMIQYILLAVFLQHHINAFIDSFIPLLSSTYGGESYWQAMELGFLTPAELVVMSVGDALIFSAFGASLAYIIRKYHEARVLGQLSRSMPPRWAFEFCGGILCAAAIGLISFQILIAVSGFTYQMSTGKYVALAFPLLVASFYAATWFARIFPFGRCVFHVNRFEAGEEPQIVLLRSFADDRLACTPVYPIPLLGWVCRAVDGRTLTNVVARILAAHGRVLVLGDPNELIGSSPGARPYFPTVGDAWRDYVRRSLVAAKMIAVIPSRSDGLRWEMGLIRDLGMTGKALFVLPLEDDREERPATRRQRLEAFRASTGSINLDVGSNPVVLSPDVHGILQVRAASSCSFADFITLLKEAAATRASELGLTASAEGEAAGSKDAVGPESVPVARGQTTLGLFFDISGRVGRIGFTARLLTLTSIAAIAEALLYAAWFALIQVFPGAASWTALLRGYIEIVVLFFFAAGVFSLVIRRLHDFGYAAFHAFVLLAELLVVAPLIDIYVLVFTDWYVVTGLLASYELFVLFLLPGKAGSNRFGAAPSR